MFESLVSRVSSVPRVRGLAATLGCVPSPGGKVVCVPCVRGTEIDGPRGCCSPTSGERDFAERRRQGLADPWTTPIPLEGLRAAAAYGAVLAAEEALPPPAAQD